MKLLASFYEDVDETPLTQEERYFADYLGNFIESEYNLKSEVRWLLNYKYVYNTDQSGMQSEMHTGRSLAFKGSEQVTAKVQSTSATTHSYTIQLMVRIDGTLHPILFICLQEASGRFPQNP